METLTITIPKNTPPKDDLIVVPRKEYEAFLTFRHFKEVSATQSQKRALRRAEKNLLKGTTLSLHEFTSKIGFTD